MFIDICPFGNNLIAMKTSIEKKLDKEILALLKRSNQTEAVLSMKEDITFSDFLSNKMLIISAIRVGIPYSLFDMIRVQTPFSESDWANILDISTKTLHRYKQSSISFRSSHSEKIIEMSEVTKVGMEVFEDMKKFKLWLDTPNFSLGNLKPLELLRDSYGKELVLSELTSINFGILV
jgi:putative toxin-antitoxin system antitoxin component (TIGR02293 family)